MKYKVVKEFITKKGSLMKVGDTYDIETSGNFSDQLKCNGFIEEIPERPNTEWDLKERDECWALYINSDTEGGAVPVKVHWRGDRWQEARAMGQITVTEEEAKYRIARRKAEQVLLRDTKGFKPDWYNKRQDKFCVSFYLFCGDRSRGNLGHLQVENAKWLITRGIYFATKEDAEASIKTHPNEWKTYLGVEKEWGY